MKILIKGYTPEKRSLVKAFKYLQHQVALWNGPTSAFDTFDKFEPDVFITDVDNINMDVIKCLKQRPYLKSIVKTKEVIKDTSTAKDLNIIFYSSVDLGNYPIIRNSADMFIEPVSPIDSEICYVGEPHPYLIPTLVRSCSKFDYNTKIFGDGWRMAQYCGKIENENNARSGARINIVINSGEASSILYNNYFRGYFTICDPCDIPHVEFNEDNFKDVIETYLNNHNLRKEKILEFREFAIKNTSVDRAKEILDLL